MLSSRQAVAAAPASAPARLCSSGPSHDTAEASGSGSHRGHRWPCRMSAAAGEWQQPHERAGASVAAAGALPALCSVPASTAATAAEAASTAAAAARIVAGPIALAAADPLRLAWPRSVPLLPALPPRKRWLLELHHFVPGDAGRCTTCLLPLGAAAAAADLPCLHFVCEDKQNAALEESIVVSCYKVFEYSSCALKCAQLPVMQSTQLLTCFILISHVPCCTTCHQYEPRQPASRTACCHPLPHLAHRLHSRWNLSHQSWFGSRASLSKMR